MFPGARNRRIVCHALRGKLKTGNKSVTRAAGRMSNTMPMFCARVPLSDLRELRLSADHQGVQKWLRRRLLESARFQ